ncbi:MAG: recombinase family protein [Pirellulales bacterium]|nr:recombinase family protein [Pirellulales bacterium]
MPIIAYARFSPRPNAQDCHSVERQWAEIDAWAARQGWSVKAHYADRDISGADRERAGLFTALAELKRGDRLVVRDWSRLARDAEWSIVLAREIERKGAKLVSISEGDWSMTDNPTARFVSTVFAALAEMQRELSRSRTSAMMLRHQSAGRAMGSVPPYGYRKVGKKLLPVPDEQSTLRLIRNLHAQGLGASAIATRLNDSKIRCRGKGRLWHASTVWRILRRG